MAKPAARISDPTSCPIPGHGTNPIAAGSPNVLFDGLAAARQGDPSACGSPLASGLSSTVIINGLAAATVSSAGSHGNVVIAGSGTVVIGDNFSPAPFLAPTPLIATKRFARDFLITCSETGQPLNNRQYIAQVDGIEQSGFTNEAGVAHIDARTEASTITIHILFKSPVRHLTELSE